MVRDVQTLCYLLDSERGVYLGRKRRKLGEGFWNGPGGKQDRIPILGIEEPLWLTAVRETYGEVGSLIVAMRKHAVIDFHHGDDTHTVHTYLATRYMGTPRSSEELGDVRRFSLDDLPKEDRFPSDEVWVGDVLAGKYVCGSVRMDLDYRVTGHDLVHVDRKALQRYARRRA